MAVNRANQGLPVLVSTRRLSTSSTVITYVVLLADSYDREAYIIGGLASGQHRPGIAKCMSCLKRSFFASASASASASTGESRESTLADRGASARTSVLSHVFLHVAHTLGCERHHLACVRSATRIRSLSSITNCITKSVLPQLRDTFDRADLSLDDRRHAPCMTFTAADGEDHHG